MGKVSQELMGLLVCPETHAPLIEHEGWLYSTDRKSRKKYPIRDGIPIMLIDESETAKPAEHKRVMAAHKRA